MWFSFSYMYSTSIFDMSMVNFSCFHVLSFYFPNWLVLLYITMFTSFAGPVMTKFTIALREIGTYKEVLRSQVEHQYVHYYGSAFYQRTILSATNL